MSLEPLDRLSPRERSVLISLMTAATIREIAEEEHVSLSTVRGQIHSIISKLGVRSQLAAVVLAYQSGWPGTRNGWAGEASVGAFDKDRLIDFPMMHQPREAGTNRSA